MKIVVTGDTHFGFSQKGDSANLAMLKEIKARAPDIFVHTGDFGSHLPLHRHNYWDRYRRIMGGELPTFAVQGNHDFWSENHEGSVAEVVADNARVFDRFGIVHAGAGAKLSLAGSVRVALSGFDGWYSQDVRTNDALRIPRYRSPEGLVWLRARAKSGFDASRGFLEGAKRDGYVTIMITHFGFIEAARNSDWKSRGADSEYFGGDLTFEAGLTEVDYLLFGHSHSEFMGVAENGRTRCVNVGSDYEFPRFRVIEIE